MKATHAETVTNYEAVAESFITVQLPQNVVVDENNKTLYFPAIPMPEMPVLSTEARQWMEEQGIDDYILETIHFKTLDLIRQEQVVAIIRKCIK